MSLAAPDAPDDDGFADFFAMSLDCLCVAGIDGYLRRVNASWTRTLGWTPEELLARPSLDFLHPDDRAAALAARARLVAREPMGPLRNRYRCKDGSYRWFEWRSIAHFERGVVYAAARDVTEQMLAEERLREASAREVRLSQQLVYAHRLASVGTLASGVAHEINNPLAAVTANIEMLLDRLATAGASSPTTTAWLAESRAMALDVQAGAARIQHIVRELATYSRGEGERLIVLEVGTVVGLAAELAAGELSHRAALVKELGPTPRVLADEASLAQVLINLIVNAVQALPTAACGDANCHEVRIVTSTDAAGRAVIEVRDNGPGIPAAIIDRIFDPFFTTKPVGADAGLGLYVCHNLVSAMGGELTASNGDGGGAIFRVALPAARAVAELAAPAPAPAPAPASASDGAPARTTARATILVVDDDRAVGVALCRVLREHDVCAVTQAKRGLEMLEAGQEFDVIISDLMMPEMSGMDFYDELARRFPAAAERVVFISGGTFTPSAQAFLGRVSNARLAKPFDAHQLRALVDLVAAR
jgi:two-component system cell cycle sensor histidine kinase/response regulator CckA